MDEILERNKNLNRGFRKLNVWREAIDLYTFEKKILGQIKGISFKIKDQILASDPQITQIDADYEKEKKNDPRIARIARNEEKEKNSNDLYRGHYVEPERISGGMPDTEHKVIYCVATLD